MNKKTIKRQKFDAVKSLIFADIAGEIDLPDKCVILPFADEEISSIFTKKRIELIRELDKKKPKTIKSLADNVGRKLSAVDRDLKLLIRKGIVETRRNKLGVQPTLKKAVIIIPIVQPKKLKEMIAYPS
tara:strand:- start:95 stop:481 length:387 start_codon:yes stop_codon:yes gene_type:complete